MPNDLPPLDSDRQKLNDAIERLRAGMQRIIACNPFYLLSAGLILFGVGQLMTRFFDQAGEAKAMRIGELAPGTLEFLSNVGTLEVYGLLLVVTAVFLARRRVWYDATLLAMLAFIFLPMSCIMLSFGFKYELSTFWITVSCVTIVAAAIAKGLGLRFLYPRLKLSWSLLGIGFAMILANVIMPIVFHRLHVEGADKPHGPEQLQYAIDVCTLVLLPILAFAAMLLPQPESDGQNRSRTHVLPLVTVLVWATSTGFHLFWMTFVYSREWEASLLLPLIWAMSWLLVFRAKDFSERIPNAPRDLLTIIPVGLGLVVLGFAFFQGEGPLLPVSRVILVVNLGIAIWRGRGSGKLVHRPTVMLSLYALFATIPLSWGQVWISGFDRHHAMGGAVLAMIFVESWCRRRCVWSLCAATAVLMGLLYLLRGVSHGVDIAFQAAYWCFLLHSVRWPQKPHWGASILRHLTATVMLVHAWLWVFDDADQGARVTLATGLAVLIAWGIAKALRQHWAKIIPVAAALTASLVPAFHMYRTFQDGVGGFIGILLGLALFGAGTLFALSRREPDDAVENGEARVET